MLFRWERAFVILISVYLFSCNNNAGEKFDAQDDSTAQRQDSLTMIAGACDGSFFGDLEKFKDSTSSYLIVDSNRRITITQYFRDEYMSPISSYGLKDLDGDGKKELIIYNNTGGAHCCDEFSIFSQTSETDYTFSARLMGDACVSPFNNVFTFSFNESFGYFFSCYACTFRDSTSALKTMRALRLQFRQGKLEVLPYSKQDEKQNLANFDALRKNGFEKINGMMDNGWRKEFAINTVLWHYNHGKDWTTTKTLFDKYYDYPDHDKVWAELYDTILDTSHENSF